MAATVNWTLYQGATFSRNITWKTGTPKVPVNLTGYSAAMQLRPSASSKSVALSLTSSNGGIVITPLTGTFTLNVSATQSSAIPAGRYVYDFKATSGSGQVTPLLSGSITVPERVTRP